MLQTITNLAQAYVGECQARNRYTYYAKVAQKEGFEQIGEVFLVTAEQERIHAKRIFEQLVKLQGETGAQALTIEAEVPTIYADTAANLQAAINGEKHEHTTMYPEFAQVAREEKMSAISARFMAIAKAEEHHQERFQKLLDRLQAGETFKRPEKVWWVCRECGYVHYGTQPPAKCPSCDHPIAFYQLKAEEY